jgi:hypothetical protein
MRDLPEGAIGGSQIPIVCDGFPLKENAEQSSPSERPVAPCRFFLWVKYGRLVHFQTPARLPFQTVRSLSSLPQSRNCMGAHDESNFRSRYQYDYRVENDCSRNMGRFELYDNQSIG